MADTSNLTNFLTDVADAIRTKTGKKEDIPAKRFDQEILEIKGGGEGDEPTTATPNDILYPKTAYSNGTLITGSISTTYGSSQIVITDTEQLYVPANVSYPSFSYISDGNYVFAYGGVLYIGYKHEILKQYNLTDISSELSGTVGGLSVCKMPNVNGKYLVIILIHSSPAKAVYFYYKDGDIDLESVNFISFTSSYSFSAMIAANTMADTFYIHSRGYGLYKMSYDENTKQLSTTKLVSPNDIRPLKLHLTDDDLYLSTSANIQWDGSCNSIINLVSNKIINTNNSTSDNILFTYNGRNYALYADNLFSLSGDICTSLNSNVTSYMNTQDTKNSNNKTGYTIGEVNNGILALSSNSGDTILLTFNEDRKVFDYVSRHASVSGIYYDVYKYGDTVAIGNTGKEGIYVVAEMDKHISSLQRAGDILYNTNDATAVENNILFEKTAYIGSGKVIGKMLNNGQLEYDPIENKEQLIPEGYTSGGKVNAVDITKLSTYRSCLDITDKILYGQPLEYIALEYVGTQSGGGQYFNLGAIQFEDNMELELGYMKTNNIIDYERIFGNGKIGVWRNGNGAFGFRWNGEYNALVSYDFKTNQRYDIKFGNKALYVDNDIIGSYSASISGTQNPMYLCYAYSADRYADCRIYYFRVIQNGTVLYNFVPAKDLDNKVCLYEKIEKKFYYNIGSGDFIAGPEL